MLSDYQPANYNRYITISNSSRQAKNDLTYIIFSNILHVWRNQRHGIGRCINVRGASMFGSLVKKQIIQMFVLSVKALTGTSRAKKTERKADVT